MKANTGVMLVNTGSPAAPTPEAVKDYLADFLMDPHIRPMPAPAWWTILHAFILPKRKVRSAAKYQEIWMPEGSPLVVNARALAEHVEAQLQKRGTEGVTVRSAMSYGEPNVATVLSELRELGCTRVVVIPMYPQSAFSTAGAVFERVDSALTAMDWAPELVKIEGYGMEPFYLAGLARSINATAFSPARDKILFSLHSVPQPDIDERGDSYDKQVAQTLQALTARLAIPRESWTVSFQSPFEDERVWHGPFTVDVLEDFARGCTGDLYLMCPGFAVDCLETLYDIPHDFQPKAEAALPEGSSFHYIPCLNSSAEQVLLVTKLIEENL